MAEQIVRPRDRTKVQWAGRMMATIVEAVSPCASRKPAHTPELERVRGAAVEAIAAGTPA